MSWTRQGIRFWNAWKGLLASGGNAELEAVVMTSSPGPGQARSGAWPLRAPGSNHAGLDQALVQHRVGDLEEAANVGAVDEIARRSVLLRGLEAGLVDRDHDGVQPLVHLVAG